MTAHPLDRGVNAVRRYNPDAVESLDVLAEAMANARHKEPTFDSQDKMTRARLVYDELHRLRSAS